jgi:hypothetical protein
MSTFPPLLQAEIVLPLPLIEASQDTTGSNSTITNVETNHLGAITARN